MARQKSDIPNRYSKVQIGEYSDGSPKFITWGLKVMLYFCEQKTGYAWDVTQGCFHKGDLSANTHLGADIIDITSFEAEERLRIWKNLGGFGWVRDGRDSADFAPPNDHVHIGILNSRGLSDDAKAQRRDWRLGLNGLANHAKDRYIYRPDPPVVFDYPKAYRQMMREIELGKAEEALKAVKKGSKLYDALLKFIIRFRKRSQTNH